MEVFFVVVLVVIGGIGRSCFFEQIVIDCQVFDIGFGIQCWFVGFVENGVVYFGIILYLVLCYCWVFLVVGDEVILFFGWIGQFVGCCNQVFYCFWCFQVGGVEEVFVIGENVGIVGKGIGNLFVFVIIECFLEFWIDICVIEIFGVVFYQFGQIDCIVIGGKLVGLDDVYGDKIIVCCVIDEIGCCFGQ